MVPQTSVLARARTRRACATERSTSALSDRLLASTSDDRRTSFTCYLDLAQHTRLGASHHTVVELLLRLCTEVEALRQALADPRVPAGVRASDRDAHARTVTLAHDAAGPTGGREKILRSYFNREPDAHRLDPELTMAARLGAGPEEVEALRATLEEVELYT
jgi:hypothetical protein